MKNVILSFVLLFLASDSFAQVGIKGGINASRISTDNDDISDLKSRTGYQLGFMAKINLSDSWAIQPEILYTRKGAKYNLPDTEVKTGMEYIDVPVVLMYTPLNLPISFHVGPQFSYLVRTDVTYKNTLIDNNISFESQKGNFEDYDFGFVTGLGFQINRVVLELRYSRGLKKFEKDTTIGNLRIEPSSKHYALQASLGYYF